MLPLTSYLQPAMRRLQCFPGLVQGSGVPWSAIDSHVLPLWV